MYSAQVIMAALVAKAAGAGWRGVAVELGTVPGTTVRGWLRRFGARAEAVRVFFTRAAVATGIDVMAPGATGSPVGDAVAAVGWLVAAVEQRFGAGAPGAVRGEAGGWQVASAASGGRLLSPGWPGDTPGRAANTTWP